VERADVESAFVAAVLDRGLPTPAFLDEAAAPRAARAFEVYRNNYRVNLQEALRVTYPVTAQLVGDEFFAAMINVFVTSRPPRSPVLIEYGGELPAFISQFEPAAAVPYLADVARLEAAWNDAYHAAESGYLQPSALAGLTAEALAVTRVALHASLQLVRSSFAVASIWELHRSPTSDTALSWEAEDALVLRPDAEVLVLALKPGCAEFVMALREGRCIAEAASTVLQDVVDFDTGDALVSLLSWGAIARLDTPNQANTENR
jgi:hypothetical protein